MRLLPLTVLGGGIVMAERVHEGLAAPRGAVAVSPAFWDLRPATAEGAQLVNSADSGCDMRRTVRLCITYSSNTAVHDRLQLVHPAIKQAFELPVHVQPTTVSRAKIKSQEHSLEAVGHRDETLWGLPAKRVIVMILVIVMPLGAGLQVLHGSIAALSMRSASSLRSVGHGLVERGC